MKRTVAVIAVALTFAVLSLGDVAIGQGLSRPQAPGRSYTRPPTLSPYLDYFRTPQGPLDSYHEYVRPQINLRNTLTQQDRALRSQSRGLRALDSQWQRAQRSGTLAPTGTGAGFFNYSHFYPGKR
jgi:hypothetical protein